MKRIKTHTRRSERPGATLKRLFGYMWQDYKLALLVVVACILLSAFANVRGSLFLQTVIDEDITPILQGNSQDFSGLMTAIIQMGAIYLVGILATWAFNIIMVKVSQGTQKKIRDDMFSHMETLPIRYFDQRTQGDIMSYYTNDIDTLRQMISQSIPNLFAAFVTFISVFIAMFSVSVPMTFFVILSVSLMMATIRVISGRAGQYFGAQQHSLGKLNGYIEEMVHGQKVVKVFNHEEKVIEGFDSLNEELRDNATNANVHANSLMPIMMNLLNIQYCLIAVVGGLLSVRGTIQLTIGQLASFLQLSRSLNNPIAQISQQINFVIMALAGAERIFQLLDEQPETDEGYVTLVNAKEDNGVLVETPHRTGLWAWKHPHEDGSITYTEVSGDVVFESVNFGYVDDQMILKDINLFAKPGQKVAFVGATGAGKTTITNLINRFYDIQEGKIRYDGINIKKIKKESLRHSLGIVLQDTHLFTGTVRENIRYGKLDATDEEVIKAAKLANAEDFIANLPNGYETIITGDGEGLSQGQRQLLAIARAAIADPPVMILDEATSSIDTRTEGIVQRGMDSLMHGRTVFVIAHRLSTIKNSDVIMVLDHGRIIERGDHDSLLSEKGVYYQLYTGALELD
ncbi:ABC transporter ATP-binding protein [Enterococcus massiliensis]|uniref:ABC transporter ATP-binding protein n=1 Tax=Enterococcus massiliensis TaxID=1640685 RepID=UPI00065E9972|nr:ABC transporter ATP-binding protein [Enterococcus massiliensis]